MEWDKYIEELTSVGSDEFQWTYRMEYSSFLKLCTIISLIVQFNDQMSRHRAGKDSITVEIILHCFIQRIGGGSHRDMRLSAGISPATFIIAYTSASLIEV